MKPVLLVEDEIELRTLVAEHLTSAGYQLRTAPDGREAIALLGSGQLSPSLLILDVWMPHVDGYGVLRWLADRPELQALRVVLTTGSPLDAAAVQQGRVVAVVGKPYHPDQLLAAVKAFAR